MRLILFFAVYVLIYGGINFHFWYRLKTGLGNRFGIAAAVVLFLLFVAPVAARIFDAHGLRSVARTVAFFGMNWMGIVLLFLFYALLTRLCLVAFQLGGVHIAKANLLMFALPFGLAILSAAYGRLEVERINLKRFGIEVPSNWHLKDGLKIVHISDLHLGLMADVRRANKIGRLLKRVEPDILVLTGDAVDAATGLTQELQNSLSDFPANLAKLATTGNHEFYIGVSQAVKFLEGAGFKVLKNERVEVGGICFVGVDDEMSQVAGDKEPSHRAVRLLKACKSPFKVLLKHRPDLGREAESAFDLMLCGHTHGGQIFPFSLITAASYRFYRGLYKLGDSFVYVNSGTGTWGPQIRFFAAPEIAVFEITQGNELKILPK